MILLVLGLILWWLPHLWTRIAPDSRAAMGAKGRGIVAALIAAGIVLMIVGFRMAPFIAVWDPPYGLRHLNNLMVLIAFYLFAVAGAKTRLHRHIRHPQLTGVIVWAVAHLLVNGDLASIILFGGVLIWAVAEILLINRAEPAWTPPPKGPIRKEFTSVLATLVLFGLVGTVHRWLGYNPFG